MGSMFVFIMLALDLGCFSKHTHKVPVKKQLSGVRMDSPCYVFDLFIYLERFRVI